MAGLNKVILIGHLGRDPDVKQLPSGDPVTNLSIATSDSWTDRATGQRQDRTEWHYVAVFGKPAEVAGKYLRKGSKVYLEGKLQTRKWEDNSGNERESKQVVVSGFNSQLLMLDRAGDVPVKQEDQGLSKEELDDAIPF